VCATLQLVCTYIVWTVDNRFESNCIIYIVVTVKLNESRRIAYEAAQYKFQLEVIAQICVIVTLLCI
jgi:hypothetical protein